MVDTDTQPDGWDSRCKHLTFSSTFAKQLRNANISVVLSVRMEQLFFQLMDFS